MPIRNVLGELGRLSVEHPAELSPRCWRINNIGPICVDVVVEGWWACLGLSPPSWEAFANEARPPTLHAGWQHEVVSRVQVPRQGIDRVRLTPARMRWILGVAQLKTLQVPCSTSGQEARTATPDETEAVSLH